MTIFTRLILQRVDIPENYMIAAVKAALEAGRSIMEIYGRPLGLSEIDYKADDSPLTVADRAAHARIVTKLEQTRVNILSEEGAEIPFGFRREWKTFWMVDPLDGTKEFISRNGEFTVNIALIKEKEPVLGVVYLPVTGTLYFGAKGYGTYRMDKVREIIGEPTMGELKACSVVLPQDRHDGKYVIVASRSHTDQATEQFIEEERKEHRDIEILSCGSSLKICRIAEGSADVYPRFGPTMEWDTAAGDALLRATGSSLVRIPDGAPLEYNKENLLNPGFIARRAE